MNNYEKVNKIATEGYQIDFGIVFEKAFTNYKNIFGIAGLSMLIFCIIFMVLLFGILFSVYGMSGISETLVDFNPTMMSSTFIIFYILFVILFSGIVASINAGFYKMAHSANVGKEYGIGTMFDFFKTTYFKELFVSAIIVASLTTGISLLFEYLNYKIIGVLITYIISFFTVLTIPLIIFSELKAIESISMSIKIVLKQPFIILGLLIVSVIMGMLGLFAFCIGFLFTIPFIFSMVYSIYNEILPIEEKSIIDEIGIEETN